MLVQHMQGDSWPLVRDGLVAFLIDTNPAGRLERTSSASWTRLGMNSSTPARATKRARLLMWKPSCACACDVSFAAGPVQAPHFAFW
jgi:hypothetical protein